MISLGDLNALGNGNGKHPDPTAASPNIVWTKAKLKKFRRAFAMAVAEHNSKEAVFKFEGHNFLVGYAAYLIEFLGNKFK